MALSSFAYLGTTVLTVAWVFAGLAAIVVVARYYARLKIMRRFTIDDFLILITFILGIGNNIFLTISVHWGLGTHMAELSPDQVMYSVKWVFLCEFFSILSPGIGRIAYAVLLLDLVPPIRWRTRFLWSIIFIQFIVDILTIIISFSQCRPLKKFWDHSVPGSCWPATVQQDTGFFQGSVCSAVDLALASFPASMFWNLNLEWKKKLSLSCLMGLGIFAMIASIIKTVQLKAITATADLTHAMAELAIWWTLEVFLVLIATSIPTLKPIIRSSENGSRSKINGSKIRQTTFSSHRSPFKRKEDPQLLREENNSPIELYSLDTDVNRGIHMSEQSRIEKTRTIGIEYETAATTSETPARGR